MKNFSALLSSLIFLFISATEARKNPQICSSSCGDIHDISYPFRLKEDPAGCGDPDFQLSCKNNKTILNFHGGFYYVKRISYDERTIRVADVNLASGSCSLPNRSLSMQEVLMDARYPGLADYSFWYALNFVRCSNNISDLAKSRAPCLSGNTSHVYVNVSSAFLYSYDVPKPCKVISTVPAFYENMVQNLSYETALKMQESGFDMRWSVECRDCRAKGRSCVNKFNTTNIFQCEEEYDYEAVVRLVYSLFAAVNLAGIIGAVIRFILLPPVIVALILHTYFSMRKKIDVREKSSQTDQSRGKVTRNIENHLEMPPKPVFFSAQDKCVIEPESDSPKEILIPESMERSS
ncbi:PREDICTED: uncharacterized protein LOC18609983 [Theobroma cacao]|uniref:RING-type E3 ubiquitin transferase n=1 Tax=Theobroma cacao TaxID=3641 RepID=A0AB32VYU1_THECC|nr:PREDICTED: uncharacterized protein LOC18609983 [Theobroma cacao]